MLAPELSRLKGAPSTCVCSVGHRNEKAIMGGVIRARHEIKPDSLKSSKIPISACLACSCSTKLKDTAKPETLRGNRKSETFDNKPQSNRRRPCLHLNCPG